MQKYRLTYLEKYLFVLETIRVSSGEKADEMALYRCDQRMKHLDSVCPDHKLAKFLRFVRVDVDDSKERMTVLKGAPMTYQVVAQKLGGLERTVGVIDAMSDDAVETIVAHDHERRIEYEDDTITIFELLGEGQRRFVHTAVPYPLEGK